jgi:protein-tyrosine-phosphatase
MLKRQVAKRHIAVHVWSRGVAVVDHVSPELAAKLKRDGIDPLAEQPRVLVPEDLAHPDIVIAFDEAAQTPGLEHARNWTVRGFLVDYDGAKADLSARIERLVDELQRRRCAA